MWRAIKNGGLLRGFVAAVLLTLIVAACDGTGKPSAPVVPPQPPPPSAEEILAKIKEGLKPLDDYIQVADLYRQVTPEFHDALLKQFESAKNDYQATPEGQRALRILMVELDEKLKAAREAQRAPLTLLLCDLLGVIDPDTSKVERFRTWAQLEQKKPVIVIKGWYEPEDAAEETVFCFIEAYLPETGEVVNTRVREGDEFLGVKFLSIIGKKRGLELRYLATGDTFKVYMPLWEKYQKRQQEIISDSVH